MIRIIDNSMKRITLLTYFSFALLISYSQIGYKYQNKVIELYPDTTSLSYVQIIDVDGGSRLTKQSLIQALGNNRIITSFHENDGLLIQGEKPNSLDVYSSYIYNSSSGYKVVILPRIAIKIRNGYSINSILEKYNKIITLDKVLFDQVFILDCSVSNSTELLNFVELISKIEEVEWCNPMKITNLKKFNTLYPNQYYLHNTGQNGGTPGIDINVEPAWNLITANDNIIVAVLDEGVERSHEDLSGNVLEGLTIDYPNEYGDPMNSYYDYLNNRFESKSHGTACAGIIAAKNNNIGIKGVAYGVKILPININPYNDESIVYSFEENVANAITWAYETGGADIISCSYGFIDSDYIRNAFNNAITLGRNGKGTTVVCAAGNNSSSVCFPANIDRVISVGAIDNTGIIYNYSNKGSGLDVVAPSGNINLQGDIVTTDRSFPNGYNPSSNYVTSFGGTSAACPQVAGVVALMLSTDTTTTSSDVWEMIKKSCKKLSNYVYDINGWSYYVGYGLVDALEAVKKVYSKKLIISGNSVVCDSAQYSVDNLPNDMSVTWSISSNRFKVTPYGNQCKVTYDSIPRYDQATLSATIMKDTLTVTTLTKRIVMHGTDMYVEGIQSDIYDENGDMPAEAATFTIPATLGSRGGMNRLSTSSRDSIEMSRIPVVFENTRLVTIPDNPTYGVTEIYGGAVITLMGDRFDGMTISFSGDEAPEYLSTDGTTMLEFRMPEVSSITNVQGYYYVVLHATSEGCCHDFDLYFKVVPVEGESIGDPEISLYFTDSSVRVDFDAMEWEELPGGLIQNIPWYLSTYRMAGYGNPSMTLMHSSTNYTESKTVSISNWPSGIYLVRIDSNGSTYTKKFLKQ